MPAKKQAATQKTTAFDKEELYAYAYIEHMGNATAAARQVFKIKSNAYASKKGSEMVRKSKVQEIITNHIKIQNENYKMFMDQGPYYLTVVARRLVQIIEDDKTPIGECLKACELLTRFAGREISEAVTIAQIRAGAIDPAPDPRPQRDSSINRKTIFMLMPPPMRPGGVPTPALEAQWREMGWKPGIKDSP